jgi:hypothetical protein
MTLAELRALCVDRFPTSTTREAIMAGLEAIVERLQLFTIKGELWVDGSFLTAKPDPADSDVVLRLDSDFVDRVSADQWAVLDWLNTDLKTSHRCDFYLFVRYPEGHPSFWLGEYLAAYWMRQWGFSRSDEMKGIAVIEL